jgi:Flp pilus assembly protein TadB
MSAERIEEDLSWIGLAAVGAARVAELAVITVAALLVVPPLAILLVVVIVPAGLLALVAAVLALPVVVVRHAHRRRAPRLHEQLRRRLVGVLG